MKVDLDFYKKNGYLILKDFLPKKDIERILVEAKCVFLRQFVEKGYLRHCTLSDVDDEIFNTLLYELFEDDVECFSNSGKQIQHLISLHSLSINTKILDLLIKIEINTPVISTRPVLYFNHPNLAKKKVYHTVDAHQDWRSMQGSLNSAVIWIPLIDIDSDLGALEILPGSHLAGLRTDHIDSGFGMVKLTDEEIQNLLPVEVEAGDVLLFSSFLIHQSGNNITNKPRWSCHFRYNDLDEPSFKSRKYAHPYIYKPIEQLITPDFPMKEQIMKLFERNNE